MAYSRWGNSNWYTFWNTSSGQTKGEQVFSMWYASDTHKEKAVQDWTYAELKNMTTEDIIKNYDCSLEDAQEVQEYIKEFMDDVNEEFSK